MSWGDGQYTDYLFKVSSRLDKAKNKKEFNKIIKNSWKYVRTKANIEKKDFLMAINLLSKKDIKDV